MIGHYFVQPTVRWRLRTADASGDGELEQIQFLLGHVSVQTTDKYLGCKQRLNGAVNDCIGIEPPKIVSYVSDSAAGKSTCRQRPLSRTLL